MIKVGVLCKWINDSQCFLLENFDTIYDSPSHIYHSAFPFSPSSSWLQNYYSAELLTEVKVVKGLPTEWGTCIRTIHFDEHPWALSHWNDIVAVGMLYGGIILLNTITGSCITTLSGHIDWVRSVTFSSDGVTLVSGSDDKTIKLWDVQTGGIIKTLSGHTTAVHSVSISADSVIIASGSKDNTIRLWNIQTEGCYQIMWQQGAVAHVNFFPTDPQDLVVISDGKVFQWDINSHQIRETYNGSHIAFSQDGAQFVLYDHTIVTVQNCESREIMAEFDVPNATHWCFSLDGRLIAAAANTIIYVWDITTSDHHITERFAGHSHFITGLVFSSPSSLISVSDDGSVKFWRIGTSPKGTFKTDLKSMENHSPPVAINLQAKEGIIITSDNNGLVKIWDLSIGHCKESIETPAIGFNMRDTQLIDERLTIAWHAEKKINIWDTKKKALLAIALSDSDSTDLRDLKISGDGSKVFLCCTEYFEALSIETGEVMGKVMFEWMGSKPSLTLDGPRVWVSTFASGWQGWNFDAPESPHTQIPPSRLHPNGNILWNMYSSRVQDLVTGNVLFQLARGFGKPDDVQWSGKELVIFFNLEKVFILDFSCIFSE